MRVEGIVRLENERRARDEQLIRLSRNDALTGELNRTYLGEKVFSDEKQLRKLNSLVHPRVAVDYQNWLTEHNEACYVVKEAALLFEAGSNKMLDKVIVVTAPDDLRIRRVLARDSHRSRQQVQDIIKRQWSEEEKVKRADFVLVNDEKTNVVAGGP